MQTKAFEIRDHSTMIPVLAIQMSNGGDRAEHYLMRRAGFNVEVPPFSVILCRLECSGRDRNATYDPYSWGGGRTLMVAHQYIEENWAALYTGDVIDVEFILSETTQPKTSERFPPH